jgi:hypothetical protein
MDDAAYTARAGIAFVIPIHPGPAPMHAVGATAAQIAENIRLFNQDIAEHMLYHHAIVLLLNSEHRFLPRLTIHISASSKMLISALPMYVCTIVGPMV